MRLDQVHAPPMVRSKSEIADRALIVIGAVLFLGALMATGYMMWHQECSAAVQASIHSAGGGDPDALLAEYQRTHGISFRRLIFGYPLKLTGAFILFYAPALIAADRRSPQAESVFLINTFCGLTIIGWVWALRKALAVHPAVPPAQSIHAISQP